MVSFRSRFAAAVLSMGAAACAFAADGSAYKDFTLTGTIQEIPGPSLRCASKFGGNIAGLGNSNVLGRVVFLSSDCITPNGNAFTFSDGHLLITTLTGEQLFADYGGQFVPTGTGTNYTFNGATFQITGGTGRYARATGGGTLSGGEDMATGKGTIQLSGRVLLKN